MKNETITALLVFLLILVITVLFAEYHRYQVITPNINHGVTAIKIDRWTGESWVLRGNTWVKAENAQ